MKTKEEFNQLKNEYESLANKLQELTEDELGYVTGGNVGDSIIAYQCYIGCNLNPDTCSAKKTTGHCPKEGI